MADATLAAPVAAPKPAAPTPAPQPAPQPSAAPAPEPQGGGEADNPFDAYDAKVKASKPKPADDAAPETKPVDKKPDTKPADAKPADEKVMATPKALREQYEKASKELTQLRTDKEQLQKRIDEAEKRGKDTTALTEQMAALQKERDEALSALRAAKQEASPEFKEKYEKPFNRAADDAKTDIEQLVVNDGEGGTRQATWNDFAELYALPLSKAIERSEEMFGRGASVVQQHLSELRRLDRQRSAALEQEKASWADRAKADEAKRVQHEDFIRSSWQTVNKALEEKNPEWYGEDPQDKEGNAILAEGRKIVDQAYGPERAKLPIARQIALDAQIRQRASAFGRMAHRVNKMQSRVAELEAENKQLRESGPGETIKPGGEQTGGGEEKWDTDLRKSLKE